MTATRATTGYGAILKRGSTAIVEMTDLQFPAVDRDMIDVTHLTSDNGFREFIAGLINAGECTITVNYRPTNATHKQIITDLTTFPQVAQTYDIVATDSGASVWQGKLLVKSFRPQAPKDGAFTAQVTFQATGPITFPSGSES